MAINSNGPGERREEDNQEGEMLWMAREETVEQRSNKARLVT